MTVAGAAVTSVKNGDTALASTQYTYTKSSGTVKLKKEYLSTLEASETPVEITIVTAAETLTVQVTITDTTEG